MRREEKRREEKRREEKRREMYFNECFLVDILNLVLRGMHAMRCSSVMWN